MKFLFTVFLSASSFVSAARENLFPADGIRQFTHWKRWQFTALPTLGDVPEGLCASSDRTLRPIWAVETSAALAFGVKKGDLLALTVVARGVAAEGVAEMLAKVQDKTYEGIFNEKIRGGAEWTRQRVFGIAKRDYSAGTLRLHLYPGMKRQRLDVRDWRLANFGPIRPEQLPPLTESPKGWPSSVLTLPDEPQPSGTIELPPLSAEERAKPRYVVIKLDDFGCGPNGASLDPKGLRVTEELKRRGLPASLGIIGRYFEWNNSNYVNWLKTNARVNGGLFDYWQHGWTHQMNIKWKDGKTYFAEYAVPDYAYQQENFEKAQRVFIEKTGLVLDGFCAPCGVITEETRCLLRAHPEIKTWLYGDTERPEGKFVFRRTCNLECRVGVVETEPFVSQYKNQRMCDYLMLQGHPMLWDDLSFAAFWRIVEQLVEDGWTFTTHTDCIFSIKLKKEI